MLLSMELGGGRANDPHYFDFDVDRAIRSQVVEKLEASPLLPLAKGVGPVLSGIYALYFKGKLVYIGKASQGTTRASGRYAVGSTSISVRSTADKTSHCLKCTAAI